MREVPPSSYLMQANVPGKEVSGSETRPLKRAEFHLSSYFLHYILFYSQDNLYY